MTQKLYSLFQRHSNGRNWNRVSPHALPKKSAVSWFQHALINASFCSWPEMRIRPVKEQPVQPVRVR